jgi:hypothetical protein
MNSEDEQQPTVKRAMTATSWLRTAVSHDDYYYEQKNPKVDASVWALLFSPIAPVGITLGIIGIVKGSSGTKNTAAIIWGGVAIALSILIPVISFFMYTTMTPLYTAGAYVTSDMGVSVRVPQGAQLLDKSNEILYNATRDRSSLSTDYGVYSVNFTINGEAPTAVDVERILLDDTNIYYDYVLYQLFGIASAERYPSIFVQNNNGVVELAAIGEEQSIVAALHFEKGGHTFVQYFEGDVTMLASSIAGGHVFDDMNNRDVDEWQKLVDSFSYSVPKSSGEFMNEY